MRLLARAGRDAIHAENDLWTSLYALVFRDLYWRPVPRMLPGPRRSGPLDVGTPGFYVRRRADVDACLARLAAEGPRPFIDAYEGERLFGLGDIDRLRAWLVRVPGEIGGAVLRRIVREGWSAAVGLPDLFVAAGPYGRLPVAVPATLRESAFLAELKGPGDTLSDAQVVWMSVLAGEGIPVEVWSVRG